MNASPRVLVVDDTAAIHQDFRKTFVADRTRARTSVAEAALFGVDVETDDALEFRLDGASQGEEALRMVKVALGEGDSYAVAFVDMRMPPGWDGIETTLRLWEADADVQVVICTAYSDYSWGEMIERLGRSDRLVILKKPFDTIEVMQIATALAEKWRLARQSRTVLQDLERRVTERTREVVESATRMRDSETQYRMLFAGNPNPMWVYDLRSLRFLLVNAAAVASYGYSEAQFLGMTIHDIRPAEDVARLESPVDELQDQGKSAGAWRHCTRDGQVIDVEVSSDLVEFQGWPARLVMASDVTARKHAEERIRRLNRVYAVLSGINSLIVRVRDRDELFQEACRIAIDAGEFRMVMIALVGREAGTVVPHATAGFDETVLGLLTTALASPGTAGETMIGRAIRERQAELSNDTLADPRVVFREQYAAIGVHSTLVLPLLVGDVARGTLVLYADQTGFFDAEEVKLLEELAGDIAFAIEYIEKQERLDYLAYYDLLTGLANRTLFLERVAQALRSAASGGHRLALFIIDLERFKNINDSLGRPAGDALLKQVGAWITGIAGDASLVARVGADHFAAVLPVVRQGGDLGHLVEKWLGNLRDHPFRLNDTVFRVAAKAGAAIYPDDGADAETLFRNAEAALKEAKGSGERYLFHAHHMTEAGPGRLTLENQLRQAIDRGEFVLHYQPKKSLATGLITAAEALIRWNDPLTGLVPPARFIPLLEETGLIYEVGRWALRQAIADYLRWVEAGLPAVRIAVNVSPLQLRNRNFAAEVAHAIEAGPGAAAGLELEITESVIMQDAERSIAVLREIRAMGVSIAIDDFGTGYSSLSYLAKLPVDTLKIDRSFVTDMGTSDGLALVSTIIRLAHSMNLKVVAEGVETEAQASLLRSLECDEMQGYLFSKPVAVETFVERFLAGRSALAA